MLRRLKGAELIILQQETGLLVNYPVLIRSKLGGTPVALWGHGHNFNPLEASAPAEWVKSKITPLADWIFAYTERSAEVFGSLGITRERITVVQNAVDTDALRAAATSGTGTPIGGVSDEIARLVAEVGERGARVGWIVSALDRWKRVPFLLETIDATRERVDDFEFFALGAGTDANILREAARTRPWLHAVGPVFGPDKAAIGRLAELTIHPGLIGLHVLDAFATASPMVTADISYHSHEIDYLEPGVNGVMLDSEATVSDFASTVAALLEDEARLKTLQEGCREAASMYTMEAMIERFAAGVRSALAAA
ncbi:MAG: glycosyltransferase family 4 protein [Actinomycetia bacterium]|nr:glycosyltransferase family 4 protein [Actinomycetes bacterium]